MAVEMQILVPTIRISSDLVVPGSEKSFTLNNSPPGKKLLEDITSGKIKYVYVFFSPSKSLKSRIGVMCSINKADGEFELKVQGLWRARVLQEVESSGYEIVAIEKFEEEAEDLESLAYKLGKLRILFLKFISSRRKSISKEDLLFILPGLKKSIDMQDLDRIIWKLINLLSISVDDYKILILESQRLSERILACIAYLESVSGGPVSSAEGSGDQLAVLKKEFKSSPDLSKRFEKFLAIQDFLSESARKVILDEFERLRVLNDGRGSGHSDYSVFINHLDFVLGLPWNSETEQEKSIGKVQSVLDADHACLNFVKRLICDYIAPKILNPKGQAGILCFVGPPGVGKTSLGASIARALNRKFVRMSVGGMHDEAEIRGHRRTYIGALPGKIMRLIKQCESKNPVFMLDEIDKIEKSSRGDPSPALLEVLDPEQNHAFGDHYVDGDFDLSQVFFICTANIEDDIPSPLRDRMDIIRLPGYLEIEKVEIAKRFLISKALTEVGLAQHGVEVTWPDEIISKLIREYTREAGVRDLTRRITEISRKHAGNFLQHEGQLKSINVSSDMIESFLGPPKYIKEEAKTTGMGVAIGLAWTAYGGEILRIESRPFPKDNKFEFSQTGNQGEIMKQANKIALTLARNKSGQKEGPILNSIHLHIPEGAIPKDGPSAGITTFCSLYSLFTGKIVRPFIAMTGEIDLEENVLPVGGIKEKVIAAMRAGIKEVILPQGNERNLYDIPQEVKEGLRFSFVSSLDEALKIAFDKDPVS